MSPESELSSATRTTKSPEADGAAPADAVEITCYEITAIKK